MKGSTRRQLLKGLGGFTLALPFMRSLLPRKAEAAAPGVPKRFVHFATHHGGIWQSNMFPDTAFSEQQTYAGRTIRRGALARTVNGASAQLSRVLAGPEGILDDGLVAKMNVIRGLDIPFYIAHHSGGHLGNYAANSGGVIATPQYARPTIDQLMAWSPNFYADTGTIRERSLNIGDGNTSFNFTNPESKTGPIQAIDTTWSSLQLFNRIFVDPATGGPQSRMPVVDRVVEDYRRLRDSDRRLSSEDRRRLDDHMQRLSELERRLNAVATCGGVMRPTVDSESLLQPYTEWENDPALHSQMFRLMNDVIVAAFVCGTSRIAAINVGVNFGPQPPAGWHEGVAHQAHLIEGTAQNVIATAHQRFFQDTYLDLIRKLEDATDAADPNGGTMLDNSLVVWTQESCFSTHNTTSIPVITAGSAGGALKTGNYINYVDQNQTMNLTEGLTHLGDNHPGLLLDQWHGTVLTAMGIQRSEYEQPGRVAYDCGLRSTDGYYGPFYSNQVFGAVGDFLPFLQP